MPHYLESYDGHRTIVQVAPSSRQEAIDLIHEHFNGVSATGSFRFMSAENFEVSCDESYVVETFTLALRHYGDGVWGVTEASSVGGVDLPADLHPTSNDVFGWLRAAVLNLQIEPSNLRIELDRVEDFHVLQLSVGAALLKSITWNVPAPTDPQFRLPHAFGNAVSYIWGDAFIADIETVRDAVVRLKTLLENRNGLRS